MIYTVKIIQIQPIQTKNLDELENQKVEICFPPPVPTHQFPASESMDKGVLFDYVSQQEIAFQHRSTSNKLIIMIQSTYTYVASEIFVIICTNINLTSI